MVVYLYKPTNAYCDATFFAGHGRRHVRLVTHLPGDAVRAVRLRDVRVVSADGAAFWHHSALYTEVAGGARVAFDVVCRCWRRGATRANVPKSTK